MIKLITLMIGILLSNVPFNSFDINKDKNIIEEYTFNKVDLSNEELEKFYIDNNILPSSIAPDVTKQGITSSNITAYLNSRFSTYSEWTLNNFYSNDVSAIYGGVTTDSEEGRDEIIISAKKDSIIKDYEYIGCGPLSVVTQFKYLASYAGYTQLFTDQNSASQKKDLFIDIFNTIKTHPHTGDIATSLQQMGFNLGVGTFTFPHDLLNGINQILLDYNINNGVGAEEVYKDGSYRKLLTVDGDILPSVLSLNTKINKVKSSIDKGMPVIWWTIDSAGYFGNHYMNIFGYETWTGTDANGNDYSHLFFKLNMNWSNTPDIYMDSDLLLDANGGFIIFEETLPKITLRSEDYGFPQQYNNSELSKTIIKNNENINIRRLRTGYINEKGLSGSGDWHITMSAKKQGAGAAYLEYEFSKSINFIYFDIRLWSSNEGISNSNGEAKLQCRDSSGNWVDAIDFLDSNQNTGGFSSDVENPDKFRYDFPYGTTTFRFYSSSINPTNASTNKGRIVIGDLGIVFSTNTSTSSSLYVTLFSNSKGDSSALNFSGHAWIIIYNN